MLLGKCVCIDDSRPDVRTIGAIDEPCPTKTLPRQVPVIVEVLEQKDVLRSAVLLALLPDLFSGGEPCVDPRRTPSQDFVRTQEPDLSACNVDWEKDELDRSEAKREYGQCG